MPFTLLLLLWSGAPQEIGWDALQGLMSEHAGTRKQTIDAIRDAGDTSLVAGLNDVLYYYYVRRDARTASDISKLISDLTGEEAEESPRIHWTEWVGRHEEVKPKKGYLAFKRSVFVNYDRAFRGYLNPRFTFRIRPEEIEWGGVPKDGIPALDEPGFIPAAEDSFLQDDERVFGIYVEGVAKAYPHRIIDPHEMANDVVGGVPVSLSYCTLCGSGVLYRGDHPSRAGNKPFTFGSSGLLYRSNKLMYDRPTNSLWNNLTGEPVAGRLAESGIKLQMLPLVVSTWGEWRKKHPDTLVLDVNNTGFDRDYTKSPYEEYFASPETMFPVWLDDDSLAKKEQVFTLIVNGRPKAYPIEVLKRERVTHDAIRGKEIVIVTNPESGAARAYESRGIRFSLAEDGTLVEDETGERWSVEEEYLLSQGGRGLDRLPGHNAYWFGWYAFYPTTEIYEPNEEP